MIEGVIEGCRKGGREMCIIIIIIIIIIHNHHHYSSYLTTWERDASSGVVRPQSILEVPRRDELSLPADGSDSS